MVSSSCRCCVTDKPSWSFVSPVPNLRPTDTSNKTIRILHKVCRSGEHLLGRFVCHDLFVLHHLPELLAEVVDRGGSISGNFLYLGICVHNFNGVDQHKRWYGVSLSNIHLCICQHFYHQKYSFACSVTFLLMAVKSGLGLHDLLLKTVIGAPLYYFSHVDMGSLLNR